MTVEKATARNEEVRAYIGASSIGNPCEAYLALSLRGFPGDRPDAQLQRIFDEGHRLEPFVVETLKATGVKMREVDPATGKQYHRSTLGGHVAANLDGMVWKGKADPNADPATHTLEVKSMNAAMFKRFQEKGVRISHPDYYDQVTMGLGLFGMQVCMFIAYCKNNSRFWIEFVYFDKARFDVLMERAASAMFSKQAVRKDDNGYECSQCLKRTACKFGPPVDPSIKHCRHCRYSMPDHLSQGKKWNCVLHNRQDVSTPCNDFAIYRPISITAKKEKK